MEEMSGAKKEIEKMLEKARRTAEKVPKRKPEVEYRKETKTYIMNKGYKKAKNEEIKATWGNSILDTGFTLLPNALLENYQDLGITDKELVILIMIIHYLHTKKYAYPAQRTLAKKTGYCKNTVIKCIKRLTKLGYLEVRKRYIHPEGQNPRRTSNVYSLLGLLSALERTRER